MERFNRSYGTDLELDNAMRIKSLGGCDSESTKLMLHLLKLWQEEKKLLSTIIDAIPVGLIIIDNNMKVSLVNKAFVEYAGIDGYKAKKKEICHIFECKYFKQYIKGKDQGKECNRCDIWKTVTDVLSTNSAVYGKEIMFPGVIDGKDTDIYLRLNAVPVVINEQNHVILLLDDISEYIKSTNEIIKTKDFYLNLMENFPAIIWQSGIDSGCNYFNKSWLDFTGRTMEEEVGYGWVENVHPQDREKSIAIYQEAFAARRDFEMEYRLRRKDGEYRWILVSGRPVYDAPGHFIGFIGSCFDITAKKEEIELLGNYQQLLQQANDIILFINSDGKIFEVNNAAVKAYGYSQEEFQTLSIFDLQKTTVSPEINKAIASIHSKNIFYKTVHYRKNGSCFPVEVSWSDITVKNEDVVLCVIRDVSEQTRYREKLEKRNHELNEAMNQLKEAQNQLVQQEKLAAIGHLAAGVAHEINNPLGYIMSNLEMFEKYTAILEEVTQDYRVLKGAISQQDYSKYRDIIDKINEYEAKHDLDFIMSDFKSLFVDADEGLDRIKKIVMGLRVFSRVDNREEIIVCNLNECIENTLIVANNEIKYTAHIQKHLGDIPEIKLSGNSINQVLLNLILNAIHAIKEKHNKNRGIISITTYADQEYVYCEIEDNGIGIPEENINKIFNPFFTTKEAGQGTGLGLSISYDIVVNLHGGCLDVESEPGVGTVFTIKLPLEQKGKGNHEG